MKLTGWLAALGAIVVLGAVTSAWPELIDPYVFGVILYAGINVILAVSLGLINGFTGQFSLGHAGFMAVGAYVSAYLSVRFGYDGPWGFALALGLGGLAAGAAGWLVGLPSLRLKGDYLAIVTLGFGEMIRVVLLNIDAVGGARGMTGIPSLAGLGWVYGCAAAAVFVIWRLVGPRGAPVGRALLAVREDELAAQAMGVDTTQAKVRAFVIGAFFAGVAGGLFAHELRYLNPQTFDFNKSFEIVIMVVLGGMGSITGSIVAAVLLTVLKEALRVLQQWTQLDFRMILYSLVLIGMMLGRPQGLLGRREWPELWRAMRAWAIRRWTAGARA